MKNREYYYYGAEIYGTEKWEEIRKNKLEEMKKKYNNLKIDDVDVVEKMPFDHDGRHATGWEVLINGDWAFDYEEDCEEEE